MKEKDPFESIVDEFAKLVDMSLQLAKTTTSDEVSPEVKERVERLREEVDKFCQESESKLIDQEPSKEILNNPRKKHLFNKVKQLEKEVVELKMAISLTDHSGKNLYQQVQSDKKTKRKQTESDRLKKKLTPIGSKKNWLKS
jgi:hypothetical protein